jgi:hypothetical protein
MTWVPGLPLDHGSITRGEHAADTLAAFLRALHVAAPAGAPVDTVRGAHPKYSTYGFNRFFDSVDARHNTCHTLRKRPLAAISRAGGAFLLWPGVCHLVAL